MLFLNLFAFPISFPVTRTSLLGGLYGSMEAVAYHSTLVGGDATVIVGCSFDTGCFTHLRES